MNILHSFQEGGVFMYFILVLGIATFSQITERVLSLYKNKSSAPGNFRDELLKFVAQGQFQHAQRYAQTFTANSGEARIAEIGCYLRSNGGGEEEMQARMDEALSKEIAQVDRRTGFLAMYGNVATLMGLLGTISGMIHSFAAVAGSNPADRATMLSKGISEAMNCTAFGLIVAIPALVAYAVFQNRTDQIVRKLTETTTAVYHDLIFLSERAQPTPSSPEKGIGLGIPTPALS